MDMPLVKLNDDGIRPAGSPRHCFYCQQEVGTPHKQDCVALHQRVVIRYTIELESEVPYHWDADHIEFHRNESSWCSGNLTGELDKYGEAHGCICSITKATFIKVTEPGPYAKEDTNE